MPTNLQHSGGYQAARSLSAQAGKIARLSIDDFAPVIGTIHDVTSCLGINSSTFHVAAADYVLPLIPAEQQSGRLSLVITNETLPEFLATGDRQTALEDYRAFCTEQGLAFDLYAALNVIYWSEREGTLLPDPMSRRFIFAHYRMLFYTFLDALACRLN